MFNINIYINISLLAKSYIVSYNNIVSLRLDCVLILN